MSWRTLTGNLGLSSTIQTDKFLPGMARYIPLNPMVVAFRPEIFNGIQSVKHLHQSVVLELYQGYFLIIHSIPVIAAQSVERSVHRCYNRSALLYCLRDFGLHTVSQSNVIGRSDASALRGRPSSGTSCRNTRMASVPASASFSRYAPAPWKNGRGPVLPKRSCIFLPIRYAAPDS